MKRDSVNSKHITLSMTGDVLISRRLPSIFPKGLQEISDILNAQDCRFGNLETTIHRREGYPEMFPGGIHVMADPLCLKDLEKLGFNVYNTANNHSMDYSHGGLLATIRHLDELGIPHCGTGKNLSDAAAPAYFECENGRVAFIGFTSSFHDSYAAGPQNQDLQGRPGVNPLRHKAVYELDAKNFEHLSEIASVTGINSYHDQARKEGYLPQCEEFKFGTYNFRKGSENHAMTTPNDRDLKRAVDAISDARYYADLVVVSVHSHQFMGTDKHFPPEFIKTFCHKCIDAGADIVICHGPHVMRGIEKYGNGIIFHGLGNFIFQHESISVLSEELYRKQGTTRQESTGVGGLMKARGKNGTVGLNADKDAWYSYFVTLEWTPEKLVAVIHPIEIHKELNNGLPFLSHDRTILEKVIALSQNEDMEIVQDKEDVKGIIICR